MMHASKRTQVRSVSMALVFLIAIACTSSSTPPSEGSGSHFAATGSPVEAPSAPDPIIEQTTESTSIGLVVKFRLSQAATCTITTDGELLPNQQATQDRPKGKNLWAVKGGTQAAVACQ